MSNFTHLNHKINMSLDTCTLEEKEVLQILNSADLDDKVLFSKILNVIIKTREVEKKTGKPSMLGFFFKGIILVTSKNKDNDYFKKEMEKFQSLLN